MHALLDQIGSTTWSLTILRALAVEELERLGRPGTALWLSQRNPEAPDTWAQLRKTTREILGESERQGIERLCAAVLKRLGA